MRRAVIDTNVLVSSFFGGKPGQVLDLWRDGYVLLCLTDAIVEEYLEVLARFGEFREAVGEFFALLDTEGKALFVTSAAGIRAIAADPADDMFLACAVAAGAEAIVSGDRHLLGLGDFRGTPILDPASFLDWMGAET